MKSAFDLGERVLIDALLIRVGENLAGDLGSGGGDEAAELALELKRKAIAVSTCGGFGFRKDLLGLSDCFLRFLFGERVGAFFRFVDQADGFVVCLGDRSGGRDFRLGELFLDRLEVFLTGNDAGAALFEHRLDRAKGEFLKKRGNDQKADDLAEEERPSDVESAGDITHHAVGFDSRSCGEKIENRDHRKSVWWENRMRERRGEGMRRPVLGEPPLKESLLSKEDREEHDTFDKRCKNDGEGKDVTSSTWVATGSFSGFRAEETDADSGGEGSGSNVKVAGDFSEECVHISVVWFVGSPLPTVFAMVGAGKGSMRVFFFVVMISVVADQLEEHRSQKHENESLNHSDEQFEEVERNRWQPGEPFPDALATGDEHHVFQNVLTRENVTVETEGKRDRSEENRDDFQNSDEGEDEQHAQRHDTGEFPFRSENMGEKAFCTVFGNRPIEPHESEGEGHRCGHVQIGVTTAKERAEGVVRINARTGQVPTDGADAWNQAKPVGEKNQNKNRTEEPERALHQMSTKNAFEKRVETFRQPLDEVLQTTGNQCDFASRKLSNQNDERCDDPDHQHRVRDHERTDVGDFLGVRRKMVMTS